MKFSSIAYSQRSVYGLLIFALICRLLFIWFYGPHTVNFGDSTDYLQLARGICAATPYRESGSVPFMRAPGLPLLLAPSTCVGASIFALKIHLVILDVASVLIVIFLSRSLGSSGFLAGTMAACYPPFLAQSADVQSEPLFMFLILLAVFSLIQCTQLKGKRWFYISAFAIGLAALTRPVALLLIPLFAASCAFMKSSHSARAALAIHYVLVAALPILPWSLYNVARFNELIIVSDGGGYNFWRGTHPELLAISKSNNQNEFAERAAHFETVTSPEAEREIANEAKTPMARSAKWTDAAWRNARSDPSSFIEILMRNAMEYWRPWLNPSVHSMGKVVISAVIMLPILLIGFLGLFDLRKFSRHVFWFFLAFFCIMWLSHVPFQVVSRFRIPLTDPFLIALSAAWLERTVFKRFDPPRNPGHEK